MSHMLMLHRRRWLFGLLVLQSLSSIVLDSYQGLLKEHFVVTLFLTTLVGAGGNAGNQSSIKVIRGLATGCIKPTVSDFWRTLTQQASVGILLAVGLSGRSIDLFFKILIDVSSAGKLFKEMRGW